MCDPALRGVTSWNRADDGAEDDEWGFRARAVGLSPASFHDVRLESVARS
jgi:hypothetical protein